MGDIRWKDGISDRLSFDLPFSSYRSLSEQLIIELPPCYLIFPASPKGTPYAVHLALQQCFRPTLIE